MKKSTKGILKKEVPLQDDDIKRELHWDEHAIQQYDLQRGKKMKITEPKTPYEDELMPIEQDEKQQIEVEDNVDNDLQQAELNKQFMNQDQQKKLDIDELNRRLKDDLQRERNQMDVDSEEDEIKKKKHEDFVKKRKEHYNEKMKIQNALSHHEEQEK